MIGSTASTDIEGIDNNKNGATVIIKFDKNGSIIWKNTLIGNNIDSIISVVEDDESNLAVVGTTSSTDINGVIFQGGHNDSFLAKYSKNGEFLWIKDYGGNGYDTFNSIETLNNEYYITGYSTSTNLAIAGASNNSNGDGVVVKYDNNGNMVWHKNWVRDSYDCLKSISLDKDGNFAIVGFTISSSSSNENKVSHYDAVILKFDRDGNLLFEDICGTGFDDTYEKVDVSLNNGYIVIGQTKANDIEGMKNQGGYDMFAVKYSYIYDLTTSFDSNGFASSVQKDNVGIITTIPNEGYEVNKIIVKNGKDEIIEVTKMEDGTYSFPLNDDVNIEVLFREKIENPKTGVFDYISFIMVGLLICSIGYISINQYNRRFEL